MSIRAACVNLALIFIGKLNSEWKGKRQSFAKGRLLARIQNGSFLGEWRALKTRSKVSAVLKPRREGPLGNTHYTHFRECLAA